MVERARPVIPASLPGPRLVSRLARQMRSCSSLANRRGLRRGRLERSHRQAPLSLPGSSASRQRRTQRLAVAGETPIRLAASRWLSPCSTTNNTSRRRPPKPSAALRWSRIRASLEICRCGDPQPLPEARMSSAVHNLCGQLS